MATSKVVYDTIDKDPATGFTVSYAKGEHVKISDGTSTVVVYKPSRCAARTGQAYENGVIQFSGSGTNVLSYQAMLDVYALIEQAIETLNSEDDCAADPSAVFDRAASDNYDTAPFRPVPEKKRPKAIPAKEHVVGHIYADANGRKWIWLGEAEVRRVGRGYCDNRSGCANAYLEYREDLAGIEKVGDNEYQIVSKGNPNLPYNVENVDTYANRKRHMEDVGCLEDCDPSRPIVIKNAWETFVVTPEEK